MDISKDKLECYMVNKGLTPPELAAITGITQVGIARIKRRGSCRVSSAIKICQALECTIEELKPDETKGEA